MKKVCTVIQYFLARRSDHHSGHSLDHDKHLMFLTTVHDVTNVEQHQLLRIDSGRPLPDVTPKRADPHVEVEGVQSRFFWATATPRVVGHVCQTSFEIPVVMGRLGEQELVVQKARTWCPIPLGVYLL